MRSLSSIIGSYNGHVGHAFLIMCEHAVFVSFLHSQIYIDSFGRVKNFDQDITKVAGVTMAWLPAAMQPETDQEVGSWPVIYTMSCRGMNTENC